MLFAAAVSMARIPEYSSMNARMKPLYPRTSFCHEFRRNRRSRHVLNDGRQCAIACSSSHSGNDINRLKDTDRRPTDRGLGMRMMMLEMSASSAIEIGSPVAPSLLSVSIRLERMLMAPLTMRSLFCPQCKRAASLSASFATYGFNERV